MSPKNTLLSSSSPLIHKRTTLSESKNGLEFVLTSERLGADRDGYIIAIPGIDHKNYDKNPIVLWNDHVDQPIGTMTRLHIEVGNDGKKLIGTLHLAPKTTSLRIAEIHNLVDAGILKAIAIAVRPSESLPLKSGAKHITKSELVSISLVAIPVNTDALMSVKGVSKELKKEIFKTQVRNASLAERIAASRVNVRHYTEQEKAEVLRKAKAKIAAMDEAKAKSDQLARNEKIKVESKARIAKQKREEDQARQDRENYQGFSWRGEDYFVSWRGYRKPIPECAGKKAWKWNRDK